jgi:hypothetical protein
LAKTVVAGNVGEIAIRQPGAGDLNDGNGSDVPHPRGLARRSGDDARPVRREDGAVDAPPRGPSGRRSAARAREDLPRVALADQQQISWLVGKVAMHIQSHHALSASPYPTCFCLELEVDEWLESEGKHRANDSGGSTADDRKPVSVEQSHAPQYIVVFKCGLHSQQEERQCN